MFGRMILRGAVLAAVLAVPALAAPKAEKAKSQAACCVNKTRCCDKVKFCCDQPDKAECCKKGVACCDNDPCCGPVVKGKKVKLSHAAAGAKREGKSCCAPAAGKKS